MAVSGNDSRDGRISGVGFVVAPRCRRLVYGFKPISPRIAFIKLRTRPRTLSLFSIYAPSLMRVRREADQDRRDQFWTQLEKAADSIPGEEVPIFAGDFNARLHQRRPEDP